MRYFPFIFIFAIIGGINLYLAHHLWRWVHCLVPKMPFWIVATFFLAMTAVMILSMVKPFDGALQRVISVLGALWMGMFLYLLLFALISDVIGLVPWLLRLLTGPALEKFRFAAGISATAVALCVCVCGFCHAQQVCTVEYDVALSEAPTSEMTVVLISDVHLGAIGSEARLEKIVDGINRLEPDLVCIAGDFFDTDFRSINDPEKAIETMKQIHSRWGVYACLGNHDAGTTLPSMLDFLTEANVTLLADAYAVIDGRLILAGRLDPSPIFGAGELRRGELAAVLEGADPALPIVMLDHNPASVDTYRNEVGLVLSGHTHRGQLFPGELITNAMFTVDYGYYRSEQGLQVIVTSGAGLWGPPMRVGTDCEIVKINLSY